MNSCLKEYNSAFHLKTENPAGEVFSMLISKLIKISSSYVVKEAATHWNLLRTLQLLLNKSFRQAKVVGENTARLTSLWFWQRKEQRYFICLLILGTRRHVQNAEDCDARRVFTLFPDLVLRNDFLCCKQGLSESQLFWKCHFYKWKH